MLSILIFFAWQICFLNQEIFYSQEVRDKGQSFYRYMPSIIILLFAALLYGNLFFRHKKNLIFNSFLAASLLYMYVNLASLILATIIVLFGVIIAILELKKE